MPQYKTPPTTGTTTTAPPKGVRVVTGPSVQTMSLGTNLFLTGVYTELKNITSVFPVLGPLAVSLLDPVGQGVLNVTSQLITSAAQALSPLEAQLLQCGGGSGGAGSVPCQICGNMGAITRG